MATKKKQISVKKKKGIGKVMPWKKALAKKKKEGKSPVEKPLTGDYISIDGAKETFSIGGAKLGSELTGVILAWSFENSWHDYAYKDGEPYPPTCFSVGIDEDEMIASSTSPDRQGGVGNACVDCELNEWGSGVGKGKACGNRRRLAMIVDAGKGKPEIKMLNISPTSLNNWKKFVEDVDNLDLHIMQAGVSITFDEDSDAKQSPLLFEFTGEIENEVLLQEMSEMLEKADEMVMKPNDVSGYIGGKKGKGTKKTSKKKSKKKSKLSR